MDFLTTLRNFIRRPAQDSLPRVPVDSATTVESPSITGAFATQHSRLENSEFIYTYNRKVVKIHDKLDFEVYSVFDIRRYNREFKSTNDYLIREIVKVTDCFIDNACLLLCTRDTNNDYRFILYDIYENKSHNLPVNLDYMATIYDFVFSEPIAHTTHENQRLLALGRVSPSSYFLVIGSKIGLSLYRLLAPTSEAPYFRLVGEYYQPLTTKEPVSAVNIYKLANVAIEETLYLIAGGINGLVELYTYDFDRKLQYYQSLDAPASKAPVTHIVARPSQTSDKCLFFIGQGRLHPSLSNDHFSNHLEIKPLIRFLRFDGQTLELNEGYEGRPESNVTNGRIISMSASIDGISHILCVGLESIYLEEDVIDGPELALFRIEDANKISIICWENISSLCNPSPIFDIDAPEFITKVDILLPDRTVLFNLSNQLIKDEGTYNPLPTFNEFFNEMEFEKHNIYSKNVVNGIQTRRNQMNHELIFDMMLRFANIDSKLYPPSDISDLETLFNAIFSSHLDRLRQHCLVYYLLKDWQIPPNYAHQKYAARFLIPPNFLCLMDGYWALDHWHFSEAIRFLTEPSVTVDWDLKVMEVLMNQASPREALQYANLTQTDEISPENTEMYMEILMRCDIRESFEFQRQYRPQLHELQMLELPLLRKLLDYCFFKGSNPDRINTLIDIRMDKYEEEFVKRYCESNDSEECKVFWIYYALHHGMTSEAIKQNELLKRQSKGTESGIVNTHMRNKYFGNLMKVLPASQQKEISMEIDEVLNRDTVVVEEMTGVSEVTDLDEEMSNRPRDDAKDKISTVHSVLFGHSPFPASSRDSISKSPEKPKNIELPTLPNHSPFSSPQNERTPKNVETPKSRRKAGRPRGTETPKGVTHTHINLTTPDRRITRSMTKTKSATTVK
ncbi:16476_t:CDS:2 [Acaulospora morrowiae]|uniref:16476_t:CDS:1 n=1 Tax=Acaulospora morrowiae TaxID=94023 RepID=A0A9N9A7M7_9GLOM|nr:16476_t:CDS:2 [Acaulospora morrowiae]